MIAAIAASDSPNSPIRSNVQSMASKNVGPDLRDCYGQENLSGRPVSVMLLTLILISADSVRSGEVVALVAALRDCYGQENSSGRPVSVILLTSVCWRLGTSASLATSMVSPL
jgi:hypothetical protein